MHNLGDLYLENPKFYYLYNITYIFKIKKVIPKIRKNISHLLRRKKSYSKDEKISHVSSQDQKRYDKDQISL